MSLLTLSYSHSKGHSISSWFECVILYTQPTTQNGNAHRLIMFQSLQYSAIALFCLFVSVWLSIHIVTPLSNAWRQLIRLLSPPFHCSTLGLPRGHSIHKTEMTSLLLDIRIPTFCPPTMSPMLYINLTATMGKTALPHRANGKGAIGANNLEVDTTPEKLFVIFPPRHEFLMGLAKAPFAGTITGHHAYGASKITGKARNSWRVGRAKTFREVSGLR